MKNKLKVFLGGTCNGSTWRDELVQGLKMDYFNPVVENWTKEDQDEEYRQKDQVCSHQLYVITPLILGVFSIAEVVDASNKNPDKTIFCVIAQDKNRDDVFPLSAYKSLMAVKQLVLKNGATVLTTLNEVRDHLNHQQYLHDHRI